MIAITIPASTNTTTAPFVRYFGDISQQFTVAPQAASSRFRLTVNFLHPSNQSARAATLATLLVTWPPQTDPTTGIPAGHVQFTAALDRN